ncbi:MAG: hypothetical protein QXX45_03250 [Candidatus Aenigmatarchaeota archaeon]
MGNVKKKILPIKQDLKEIEKKLELVVLKERLTSKEALFVENLILGMSEEEAAKQAGFKNVNKKLINKLLSDIDINQYFTSLQELANFLAPKAFQTVFEILKNGKSEKTRLEAAKIILDKTVSDKTQSLPIKLQVNILNNNASNQTDNSPSQTGGGI